MSATKATIHGTVNPNGLATTVHFDYGKTSSYGSSTQIASAGSSSGTQAVMSALAGLPPSTTYHYRLVATNAAGTRDGADRTFKTSAHTRPPTLSHVTLASSKFSAGAGTRLRFTLSERARITVVIRTKVVGHNAKSVNVATLEIRGAQGSQHPQAQYSAPAASALHRDDDGTRCRRPCIQTLNIPVHDRTVEEVDLNRLQRGLRHAGWAGR